MDEDTPVITTVVSTTPVDNVILGKLEEVAVEVSTVEKAEDAEEEGKEEGDEVALGDIVD